MAIEQPIKVAVLSSARLQRSHGGGLEQWIQCLHQLLNSPTLTLDVYSTNVSEIETQTMMVPCHILNETTLRSAEFQKCNVVLFTGFNEIERYATQLHESVQKVLVLHGNLEEERKLWFSGGWRWWLERRKLRKQMTTCARLMNANVTLSPWMQTWCSSVTKSKWNVIPNTIPMSLMDPKMNDQHSASFHEDGDGYAHPKTTTINPKNPYLEYLSAPRIASVNMLNSPHRMRDFDLYLAVVQRVIQKIPQATFFLWGGFEGDQNFVRAQQKAHGLPIVFKGYRENPWQDMKGIDLFFHPSNLDSFSITVLSALFYGYPTVASKSGGIPFVTANAALLGRHTDELYAHIIRLCENKSLRQELREQSRAHILNTFSHERFVTEWTEFLRDLRPNQSSVAHA